MLKVETKNRILIYNVKWTSFQLVKWMMQTVLINEMPDLPLVASLCPWLSWHFFSNKQKGPHVHLVFMYSLLKYFWMASIKSINCSRDSLKAAQDWVINIYVIFFHNLTCTTLSHLQSPKVHLDVLPNHVILVKVLHHLFCSMFLQYTVIMVPSVLQTADIAVIEIQ